MLDFMRGVALVGVGLFLLALIVLFISRWRRRFSFREKVILITGGSRGLGLVLARRLCREGATVALLARDIDELTRAQKNLAGAGGKVLAIQCDLTEPAQIQFALGEILKRTRGIDVLINNAGTIEVGPFDHMDTSDFERAMRLHFWAPYELVRRVLPEMKNQGGGRIVNISSIGGKTAVPHLAPYCASKFALTGFSDAIRAELSRDNIAVTTVAPGLMRTGSHVNANFKGEHDREFAWFSFGSGMPLISMSAERAARKIVAACRRGQPSLTLTFGAKMAIAGNALFPNFTGHLMKLVNLRLPAAIGREGDEIRAGHETNRLVPKWMTSLADEATARNNEGVAARKGP